MLQEKLTAIRKAKGMTQADLAKLCGFSRNSIVNWETGKRQPKIGDIRKLAEVLGVSQNDLIGDDSFNNKESLQPKYLDDRRLETTENFAYWGGVLDKARKVVERGDVHEISLIAPFLKAAYELFIPVQERNEDINASSSTPLEVSAYNGSNSNYHGNTLMVETAIA